MRRRDITKQRQAESSEKAAQINAPSPVDGRICPTCGRVKGSRKRKTK